MQQIKQYHWGRTLCSFMLVLLLMPAGHAAMILMEHFLAPTALHYWAFAMGFAGLAVTVYGAGMADDTRATIAGLIGGLMFWTGWVEFLFAYYAWRYGAHCDLTASGIVQTTSHYVNGLAVTHDFTINGVALESFDRGQLKAIRGSRPEYLIMPATFGMWMMIVMLYTLCTRTGCRFINRLQRVCRIDRRTRLKPLTRLPAVITFMELNMMLWGCYLLLMFCYDPVFVGSRHWLTAAVGVTCLAGSLIMLRDQLRLRVWGANIRMAIATVIVFWCFVEIVARNGVIQEIWVAPLSHARQLGGLLAGLMAFPAAYLLRKAARRLATR